MVGWYRRMIIERGQIKNPILIGFLNQEDNAKVYDLYCQEPSNEKRELLNRRFVEFYYKIKLITYFSKVIGFEAKRYDKKDREYKERNQLVLDKKDENNEDSIMNLFESKADVYFLNNTKLEDYIEDPIVYKIVSKLTKRQKQILYLSYINNMKDIEIAKLLRVSQQAITKTKNQALNKVRREIKNG